MGTTSYCAETRSVRASSLGYTDPNVSAQEIFQNRKMPDDMDPKQIRVREARDSEAHPESFPVIIALDQTGSMHRCVYRSPTTKSALSRRRRATWPK